MEIDRPRSDQGRLHRGVASVDSVDASDFTVEDPDVSVESAVLGGVNVEGGTQEQQQLNEIVYLTLSEELPSDARPRVELDGSVLDKAGNEQTK